MVRVEALTVRPAGAPLTFDVGDGRCVGLLGRDAELLSAVAETIGGLRAPAAGRVTIDAADIFQDQNARAQISLYLPRATHRLTTLAEHVAAATSSRTTRVPLAEAIARLGIDARARLDTPLARSAAALIAALMPDCRLVVLHDPFAGLDVDVRGRAIEWIRSLAGARTSVVITGTEERDVRAVSHSVVELGAGR